MYSTKSLNGVPTIQRNGLNVISIWDEDWEFASELCKLPNEREEYPALLLTGYDSDWLKAMDHTFGKEMQHA